MHFAPIPLEFGADLCAVCILEYLLCRHLLIDLHRCLSVAKNSWVNKFIIYSILPVRSVLVRFDILRGREIVFFFLTIRVRNTLLTFLIAFPRSLGILLACWKCKWGWNACSLTDLLIMHLLATFVKYSTSIFEKNYFCLCHFASNGIGSRSLFRDSVTFFYVSL